MSKFIPNKKLALLFLSNLVVLFVGMGLFPLLPLFAAEFGATPTLVGIHYAVMYTASVVGTIATGWLAMRVSPKILFLTAGLLGVAALTLLGVVTAYWQVVVLTAAIWFAGAIAIPLVGIFTSMVADGGNQGKSFSLIYLAYPLGAVIGGTTVGALVSRYGFSIMFFVLGAVWAILPAIALLALKDVDTSKSAGKQAKTSSSTVRLGRNFHILMLVTLLAAVAGSTGRLGTSLSMQALDFSSSAVASTATVSGLVTIPTLLLIGALTDRFGHGPFLMIGYVLTAAGALILNVATELWQFWTAATMLMVAFGTNLSVASAFIANTLTPEALKKGLPLVNTMDSVAGIVAFAGTGIVMEVFGPSNLYLAAAIMAIGAALLLSRLNRKHDDKAETTPVAPAEAVS